MTRTEQRLRDALRASADRIGDHELVPLVPAEHARRGRIMRTAAQRGWLPPLAAAASVALIAGTVVAASAYLRDGSGPGRTVSSSGAPRYYATIEGTGPVLPRVVVRAAGTGAVVATVADPLGPGPHGGPATSSSQPSPGFSTGPDNTPDPYSGLMEAFDVATADDVTFYVVYQTRPITGPGEFIIESFRISSSGQPGPLSSVRGGSLAGLPAYSGIGGLAVSPGNGKVALALSTAQTGVPDADEILVVDTQTGVRTVWRGGLTRPGAAFAIHGLSWSGDGRSLAYQAQWCYPPDLMDTGICVPGTTRATRTFSQIREIDTAAPGGALSGGRVLLAQSARYPAIGQAVISLDGQTLTAIVLSGPRIAGRYITGQVQLSVVRISVATGEQTAVLLRTRDPDAVVSALTADSSRRYLIVSHPYLGVPPEPIGWIDAARLRILPAGQAWAPVAW